MIARRLILPASLIGLLLACCGGSEKSASAPSGGSTQQASAAGRRETGDAGKIAIKDEDGSTIYISNDRRPPKGHPRDFLPSQPGTRWVYTVKLGNVDPVFYDETTWPLGAAGDDKNVSYAVRGLLNGALMKEKRPLTLDYSVGAPAEQQGPLRFPEGVELIVHNDEIGFFRDCRRAFLAISESGRYSTNLVLTFDSSGPGAPGGGGVGWGSWGRDDGHSKRLWFFVDEPGIQISVHESPDSLMFAGIDHDIAACKATDCLRLIRKVSATEAKPNEERGHLDEAFREEMWFARGKGLVYLVQTVGGQTSMTWELSRFIPGK